MAAVGGSHSGGIGQPRGIGKALFGLGLVVHPLPPTQRIDSPPGIPVPECLAIDDFPYGVPLARPPIAAFTPSTDAPPVGVRPQPWLSTVLQAWVPPDPLPQPEFRPPIAAFTPSTDRPQPRGGDWLSGVLRAWQPPDPQPILPGKIAAFTPSTDAPRPRGGDWQSGVLRAWQPPDPQPILPGKIAAFTKSVDTPQPRGGDWLTKVLGAWVPPDPQPILPGKIAAFTPSTDAPPPFRRTDVFWPADPYYPQLPRYVPPVTSVAPQVNNPPFGQRPLDYYQAWIPPFQYPQTAPPFTPSAIYNPPPGIAVPHVVAIDDFPYAVAFSQPPVAAFTPSTDAPQPRGGDWLTTVLQAWIAPFQYPQTTRPLVQPFVVPPPVNNPPFGQRPIDYSAAWVAPFFYPPTAPKFVPAFTPPIPTTGVHLLPLMGVGT